MGEEIVRLAQASPAGQPVGSAAVAYHEGIAADWAEGYRQGSFNRRRALFRAILERIGVSGGRWLDLGCGAGVLTAELLDGGAAVTAVDGSPAMIAAAMAQLGPDDPGRLRWLVGDALALPQLADASCDGVLCSSVVEYVEQPAALLAEIVRVLRPAGRLVISVPPRWSPVRLVQKIARALGAPFGYSGHAYLAVSRFEIAPRRIGAWLGAAGFRVDQVNRFDPFLTGAVGRLLRPALLVIEATRTGDDPGDDRARR